MSWRNGFVGLLYIVTVGGLFVGLLWLFDLADHPDIGWGHLTGGVVAMPLFMFIIALAGGSSRIESVVKMVFCAVLLFVPSYDAVFGVYAVSAFTGAAAPVIISLLPDTD